MPRLSDTKLEQLIWVYIRLRKMCGSHQAACSLIKTRYGVSAVQLFAPSKRVLRLVQRKRDQELGKQWWTWREHNVVGFHQGEEVVLYLERTEAKFWHDIENPGRDQG